MKIITIQELDFNPIEVSSGDTKALHILWVLGQLPQVCGNPIHDHMEQDRKIATAASFLMIPLIRVGTRMNSRRDPHTDPTDPNSSKWRWFNRVKLRKQKRKEAAELKQQANQESRQEWSRNDDEAP